MNKRYVLKNRRRFFTIVLVVTLLTACVFAGTAAYGYDEPSSTTVTVKAGDTLWNIAKECYSSGDVRKHIYDIQLANNLTSCNIHPGDELLIP